MDPSLDQSQFSSTATEKTNELRLIRDTVDPVEIQNRSERQRVNIPKISGNQKNINQPILLVISIIQVLPLLSLA
jgi:hypothetical protein